jgi:tetratricopeptide (TPR) repeat protein
MRSCEVCPPNQTDAGRCVPEPIFCTRTLADFDAAIRNNPKLAAAYYYRAAIQMGRDPKRALADISKAISLNPKDHPPLIGGACARVTGLARADSTIVVQWVMRTSTLHLYRLKPQAMCA